MSYEEKLEKRLNDEASPNKKSAKKRILTAKQKEALRKFANTLHRATPRSKLVYIYWLKAFTNSVNKEFNKVTREDVDSYLSTLGSDYTYNSAIIMLKRFFNGRKDLKLNDLKLRMIDLQISPSELLTPEEVVKLANAMGSQMLKAFVLTVFESCARVNEVLTLRIGDIEFDFIKDSKGKEGLLARLSFNRSKGKVLKQPVVMSMFALELKGWLESHPHKNNPQAYLFYSEKYAEDGSKPLTHDSVYARFRRAARRTGITKRTNPHWLRHSMLSYLSNRLNYNEQLLMWRAGWKNTTMAKRYIHSGAELENNAYLQKLGYTVEKKEIEPIKPKPCFHCHNLNPYTNDKCDSCGMPLDSQEYARELEKRQFLKSFDPEDVVRLKQQVTQLTNIIRRFTLQPEIQKTFQENDRVLKELKTEIIRFIAAKCPTDVELHEFMEKRGIDHSLLKELSDDDFGGCVHLVEGRWIYNEKENTLG